MDLVPMQNRDDVSTVREIFLAFSYRRCSAFLLIFTALAILSSGIATLIIIFVVKPRTPTFTLQTINIDSYKLDVGPESTLLASSVVTLILSAQNPNKVGIRYGPSRLHVLSEGLVVGLIRVPGFYQPAKSFNVSVETRLLFERLNVNRAVSQMSSNGDIPMRILGDIVAHIRLLPRIKVALECDVDLDYEYISVSHEASKLKAAISLVCFLALSLAF